MEAKQLWELSPEEFNNWRRENDYPAILNVFERKLPKFHEWMVSQGLSSEIIFKYGIARFISSDKPVVVCEYETDCKTALFESSFDRLPSLIKCGHIKITNNYQPYFYWLQLNHGKKIFEQTKRDFIISSWINGKPQFLKEHFLLNLGGAEINSPVLADRLLDFTCLDDLNIIAPINNKRNYLWHCSAIGLHIRGGVAFLNFYKTKLWSSGYREPKRELILSDGIFQDFHFKDCDLRFHATRSTLKMCSISGTYFQGTLEHTNVQDSSFKATPSDWHNFTQKATFYNAIKTMYSSIGNKSEAGKYFYKEKVNEMISFLSPKKSFRRSWLGRTTFSKVLFTISCIYRFIFFVVSYVIWGFGEKPFRSLFVSIAVIVISAFTYYLHSYSETNGDAVKSMYYSIVTFVTLGYGDISQKNEFLQIFSSLEAFSGMVLMGLFLAGYASKSKEY